jgi:threonine dehydrogenase-like Zn-dependent dehydrogenase
MLATIIYGERDVRLDEVPDPTLDPSPTANGLDAVVRVVAACVCGSDLWA